MKQNQTNLPQRMWINQPSTLQPLHHLHGQNVLAVHEHDDTMRIYFLSGPVISQQARLICLSQGWNADEPVARPAEFDGSPEALASFRYARNAASVADTIRTNLNITGA